MPSTARARRHGWLWSLVALQAAIPLTYYLGDDPEDERFAWRMFSAVRMERCVAEVSERGAGTDWRPVPLTRTLHSAWLRTLERKRRRVVEAVLRRRCARPGVTQARFARHCLRPDGEGYTDGAALRCGEAQLRWDPAP